MPLKIVSRLHNGVSFASLVTTFTHNISSVCSAARYHLKTLLSTPLWWLQDKYSLNQPQSQPAASYSKLTCAHPTRLWSLGWWDPEGEGKRMDSRYKGQLRVGDILPKAASKHWPSPRYLTREHWTLIDNSRHDAQVNQMCMLIQAQRHTCQKSGAFLSHRETTEME